MPAKVLIILVKIFIMQARGAYFRGGAYFRKYTVNLFQFYSNIQYFFELYEELYGKYNLLCRQNWFDIKQRCSELEKKNVHEQGH